MLHPQRALLSQQTALWNKQNLCHWLAAVCSGAVEGGGVWMALWEGQVHGSVKKLLSNTSAILWVTRHYSMGVFTGHPSFIYEISYWNMFYHHSEVSKCPLLNLSLCGLINPSQSKLKGLKSKTFWVITDETLRFGEAWRVAVT